MKQPLKPHSLTANIVLLLVILLNFSCHHQDAAQAPKKYIDSANFDFSVKPGDDFFNYANGTWLKNHPIPKSEVWWGDAKISENDNFKKIKQLLEDAAASPKDSVETMVGDMYKSGMDTTGIESKGISPIKTDLARIAAIKTTGDLLNEIILEHNMGMQPAFYMDGEQDLKNSSIVRACFAQGGIGLPEKGYYFNTDADTKAIRDAYQKYISTMLQITGLAQAASDAGAKDIMTLETILANASKTPVELRDIDGNYNRYTIDGLSKNIPGINWAVILQQMKIKPDSVVVTQPAFYKQLSASLVGTNLQVWKNYLSFHFIDNMAVFLDKKTESAHYEFVDKTLNGQPLPLERWDQVSRLIDGLMGDPLGRVYVKRYFPPAAKARMDTLVNNVEAAFEERIKKLTWMGAATKKKAIEKLHLINKKIGYPNKWRDYHGVSIKPDAYYENAAACMVYLNNDMIGHIGKKVDKDAWGMTPPTVNAYYNPSMNDINFPAGILQYPFFMADGDDAINYGGIGLVIGHELTHGFDDQGRQFDGYGNRVNWWTKDDEKRFNEKAAQIIKLYSSYTVLDSLHVNGDLTQGENIADFGGLAISFDAFKKTAQYKAGKKINGFTPTERYFLSFAQCRRRKMRDKFLANFVKTDPHAPSWYRIIGPYSNFEPFYETYNLKPGDKMYRPESERITIW
jgi:putative endopeptidase